MGGKAAAGGGGGGSVQALDRVHYVEWQHVHLIIRMATETSHQRLHKLGIPAKGREGGGMCEQQLRQSGWGGGGYLTVVEMGGRQGDRGGEW